MNNIYIYNSTLLNIKYIEEMHDNTKEDYQSLNKKQKKTNSDKENTT